MKSPIHFFTKWLTRLSEYLVTFGAFGRLWLGGWEAEVKAAAAAAEAELAKIAGREEKKS